MNLPEHIQTQIDTYAERHGLTPDQAAERLIVHGLNAVGGWRLGHDEGNEYPYRVEQTEVGANAAREPVMAPRWSLWRAAATLEEARAIVAEQLDSDEQRQKLAGLPLMMPIKGSWKQRTVWRIAKTD